MYSFCRVEFCVSIFHHKVVVQENAGQQLIASALCDILPQHSAHFSCFIAA